MITLFFMISLSIAAGITVSETALHCAEVLAWQLVEIGGIVAKA